MSAKRLLGIFAHPDDEELIGGALLHYKEQGVETALVFATRGEVGEISDPILATPENLGEVREEEMKGAAAILGIDHVWYLNYRDSGMPGTSDNEHPQAFMHARSGEAIGKLVALLREFRPQVIVTFDEGGAYGHPDHIAVYRHTTGAFHAAADSVLYPELGTAHAVSKLYYTALSRRQYRMMAEWVEGQNLGPFQGKDLKRIGMLDENISVLLDVEHWQEHKTLARNAHRTQVNPNTPIAHLPPDIRRTIRSTECYQLAATRVGPDIPGENNLFARVR